MQKQKQVCALFHNQFHNQRGSLTLAEISGNTLEVGMTGIDTSLDPLIHLFSLTIKAVRSAEWFHYRYFLSTYRHASSEYTATK